MKRYHSEASPVDCIFVSDLHGRPERYHGLFRIIQQEAPAAVFMGGDLLPLHGPQRPDSMDRFIEETLFSPMRSTQKQTQKKTRFFVILGNDDPRVYEQPFLKADAAGLLSYVHMRTVPFQTRYVTGYAYVPPTPFQLKDWERYDVSRFVDVGCVSPEKGRRTIPVSLDEARYTTIAEDLETLSKNAPADQTIYLFHSPPYDSYLDTADLAGKSIDHAPLDIHVGSIAIQRFILSHHPLVTLHGHIHEAARLTGKWCQRFGLTYSFSAAHDGPELAVVRFDTDAPENATRDLIPVS